MADLPYSLAADAFAMFRWQVALVDAMASQEDPHLYKQLSASCRDCAGCCSCWERSLRALLVELSNRVVL